MSNDGSTFIYSHSNGHDIDSPLNSTTVAAKLQEIFIVLIAALSIPSSRPWQTDHEL
jgi:hypothetical protein